jgi:serine/threonine-protein kinase HipA
LSAQQYPHRAKLAMKIGGEYRLRDIGTAEWRKLAKELHLDADELIERVRVMARDVSPRFSAVRDRMRKKGLDHEVLDRLAKAPATPAESSTTRMQPRVPHDILATL